MIRTQEPSLPTAVAGAQQAPSNGGAGETIVHESVGASSGEVSIANQGLQLAPSTNRPLDGAFRSEDVKKPAATTRPAAGPLVDKPYIVQGEGILGTAQFAATADPNTLNVTMKWTQFDPFDSSRADDELPGATEATAPATMSRVNEQPRLVGRSRKVPHRTTEMSGVARRGPDGDWQLSLPLPIPRDWDRHDVRTLPLAMGESAGWAFDSPFSDQGHLTVTPANWPEPLSGQEFERVFATPGRIVEHALTMLPRSRYFVGSRYSSNTGIHRLLDTLVNAHFTRDVGDYSQYQGSVTIEEQGEKRNIAFKYFEPTGTGPHPLVVVNAVVVGAYELEEVQMRYLAARGYATVLVHRPGSWFKRGRAASDLAANMRRTVVDQRYVLDHLLATRPLDGTKIAATGICTGATSSLALKAADDRIGPVYAIIPPSNMAELIPTSGWGGARRFYQTNVERLAAQRGTETDERLVAEQFQRMLANAIEADPMRLLPELAPLFGPNNPKGEQIKMAIATADTVVPTRWQLELWLAMGQREVDFYRNREHNDLLFDALSIAGGMVEFLDAQLGIE